VSSRAPSVPDLPPDASWLRMHWRPLITMSAMAVLLTTGIALRYLAPDRYRPPGTMSPQDASAADPVCEGTCWHGEACQMGRCVWQPPNDVGHVDDAARIAGPFELPSEMVDVLPLDGARFAVSQILGVQVSDAQSGAVLSTVSDAPQAQLLRRVGEVIYASAPNRIYVIDAASMRVLKTIEVGSLPTQMAIGASGRRVLVSMAGARAVAVIATDYHAEVSRFFFGDDPVGPVAMDDTGESALTTNGHVPLPGLEPRNSAVRHSAVYAFDPGRLPSEQDRVRTGMAGNPVDIAMLPDARTSYVALRELDRIVRVERLESGAVRQLGHMPTCKEPEQMELVRHGRRIIVRCSAGRAVEVFDLNRHELVRRIALGSHIADMAVTPDGKQAILTLPRDGAGIVAFVDLDNYQVRYRELGASPSRVRLSPDGRTALVVSDRSKQAWVIK
jgi:DNA-binding beta-propeller fold protein YncE